MKRHAVTAILALGLALAAGCGSAPVEPVAGRVLRPTVDPARPTPTPVALPSPTLSEAPRYRARGIITAITDDSLTFFDIDRKEYHLMRSPDLKFSWDELRQAQQRRDRITVVYQQTPQGLMLIDVFPS
jgi:hypothetical protein